MYTDKISPQGAFAAALGDGAPSGLTAYVGNADVKDLVGDSIKNYSHDRWVGTQGGYTMLVGTDGGVQCDSNGPGHVQIPVVWWVQRSDLI